MPLTFLYMVLASFAWAETPVGDPPIADVKPIFEELKLNWSAQGIVEFPFYSFYLGAPAVKGVAYLPNFSPRLGPRILWRDMGAAITFALPLPPEEKRRRGDSQQTTFIINKYWRQNAMDFYYQYFRGFYVSSPLTEIKIDKPERFPQLPDARVTNYGLNWYYVFRPDNYSLKAAFNQTEFQRKSGGSWIINPFYNHLDMSLGNKFVPGSDPNSLDSLPNLADGRFDTLGAGFGYGYTYISGAFFTTLQGAAGPGLQLQKIGRTEKDDLQVLSVALKMNANFSIGWNHNEYVGGFKLLVDSIYSQVVNMQVSSSLVSAQLFLGGRF